MEKVSSTTKLPQFIELAKKMSPTSRVVLTPDGKSITTIGLWQRCKRFFTVSRVDRRKANEDLAKMFEKALSENHGSSLAKNCTSSLRSNPTKLSARRINRIMTGISNCKNRMEEERKKLPQVDQAKLRVKEQLGWISAKSTFRSGSFNNLVFPASKYTLGMACAVVAKGDYEWKTYKEICKPGNIMDFPEKVAFPVDRKKDPDTNEHFAMGSICFVPDTHSIAIAKSTGSDMLFPPNTKFVVSSYNFDQRGCLLVYLSVHKDATTENDNPLVVSN